MTLRAVYDYVVAARRLPTNTQLTLSVFGAALMPRIHEVINSLDFPGLDTRRHYATPPDPHVIHLPMGDLPATRIRTVRTDTGLVVETGMVLDGGVHWTVTGDTLEIYGNADVASFAVEFQELLPVAAIDSPGYTNRVMRTWPAIYHAGAEWAATEWLALHEPGVADALRDEFVAKVRNATGKGTTSLRLRYVPVIYEGDGAATSYAGDVHAPVLPFTPGDTGNPVDTAEFDPSTDELVITLRDGEVIRGDLSALADRIHDISPTLVRDLLNGLVGDERLSERALRDRIHRYDPGATYVAGDRVFISRSDYDSIASPVDLVEYLVSGAETVPSGGGGLDEAQVDARVSAGVADWAETGDTSAIPASKLTNAPSGGGGTTTPLSDDDPEPSGTASPGTSGEASRSDHVHPALEVPDEVVDVTGTGLPTPDATRAGRLFLDRLHGTAYFLTETDVAGTPATGTFADYDNTAGRFMGFFSGDSLAELFVQNNQASVNRFYWNTNTHQFRAWAHRSGRYYFGSIGNVANFLAARQSFDHSGDPNVYWLGYAAGDDGLLAAVPDGFTTGDRAYGVRDQTGNNTLDDLRQIDGDDYTAPVDATVDYGYAVLAPVGKGGVPTEEQFFQGVKDFFVAGDNVTLTENDDDNTITIASTGGGGGGTPTPTPVGTTYAAVRTDQAFTAADFTGADATSAMSTTITLPTFTGDRYLSVAVPHARGEPSSFVAQGSSLNQISALTRRAGTTDIGDAPFIIMVSNEAFFDVLSGTTWTIT